VALATGPNDEVEEDHNMHLHCR